MNGFATTAYLEGPGCLIFRFLANVTSWLLCSYGWFEVTARFLENISISIALEELPLMEVVFAHLDKLLWEWKRSFPYIYAFRNELTAPIHQP